MLAFGRPSHVAKSFSSAALAAPLSGTARTRAARCVLPSDACPMPSMASRDDLGVSLTKRSKPSDRFLKQEPVGKPVRRAAPAPRW